MIPADLSRALEALTGQARLLLGFDFDGVIAPIVAQRDQARPIAGSMAAVRRLATRRDVAVALVSGRGLADLRAVAGISDEDDLTLIGSHGAESSLTPSMLPAMSAQTHDLLARVIAALELIAAATPGAEVEVKPTGAVLHTRLAEPDAAARATAAAVAGPGAWVGVHLTQGKSVVELAVVETSKGIAVQHLRLDLGVDAVLYVGDDVTDESVFELLGSGDVGVKVGLGPTAAAYRLAGPDDVLELLQLLVAERSQR